jgi:hypothetical protein
VSRPRKVSSEQVGGTECSFVCHVPGKYPPNKSAGLSARWSLNWPSGAGANLLAHVQLKCIPYVLL